MKKYIPHILCFVVGAIISIALYRLFVPKPKPQYKVDIERLEKVEADKQKAIDSMGAILMRFEKDTANIYKNHENIRNNGISDDVSDSLRATIIERGRKRFE